MKLESLAKIPSKLILIGYLIIFFTISSLLTILFFVDYSTSVRSNTVFIKKDSVLFGKFFLPTEKRFLLYKGDNIFMEFPEILNEKSTPIEASIEEITIQSEKKKYLVLVKFSNDFLKPKDDNRIAFDDKLPTKTVIITTRKMTLYKRITEQFLKFG